VQHPVHPGPAVAPSRAHERRPELVRVAPGIAAPFLARIPALPAGRAALRLGLPAITRPRLPAVALPGPLALHLGPALLVRLPGLLLGFRPLRVRCPALSIRHVAIRSRWSS